MLVPDKYIQYQKHVFLVQHSIPYLQCVMLSFILHTIVYTWTDLYILHMYHSHNIIKKNIYINIKYNRIILKQNYWIFNYISMKYYNLLYSTSLK